MHLYVDNFDKWLLLMLTAQWQPETVADAARWGRWPVTTPAVAAQVPSWAAGSPGEGGQGRGWVAGEASQRWSRDESASTAAVQQQLRWRPTLRGWSQDSLPEVLMLLWTVTLISVWKSRPGGPDYKRSSNTPLWRPVCRSNGWRVIVFLAKTNAHCTLHWNKRQFATK